MINFSYYLNMKINRKLILLLAVFFLISIIFFLKKNDKKETQKNITIPTLKIIPTVDASVKINLIPINQKKSVLLSIKNIPAKTKTIEYIISYETEEGGLQGVNSKAPVKGSNFEKEIILGTCSSGTCVYHKIKNNIKLEIMFKGDYGEKIFSKEYFW